MPSPEEVARRKALMKTARLAEQERARQSLPIEPKLMKQLFDFLDEKLSDCDCDHTLQFTLVFLSNNGVDSASTVSWLEEAGGCCDCEVLANAEEKFLAAFPEFES